MTLEPTREDLFEGKPDPKLLSKEQYRTQLTVSTNWSSQLGTQSSGLLEAFDFDLKRASNQVGKQRTLKIEPAQISSPSMPAQDYTEDQQDTQSLAQEKKSAAQAQRQSRILAQVIKRLPEAFRQKSKVCKHDNGCFENIVQSALTNYLVGFCLQMCLKNILLIAKPHKLLKNLTKAKVLNDSSRFGLFLMVLNTSYKLLLCLLRRLGSENDKINAPVAGFISALSLALDAGHRRELLTGLMMSRAVDASLRMGEEKGVIPRLYHRDMILFVLANCFIGSLMGLKQGAMNDNVRKFYQKFSQMKTNDKIQVQVWHKMLQDGVPGF